MRLVFLTLALCVRPACSPSTESTLGEEQSPRCELHDLWSECDTIVMAEIVRVHDVPLQKPTALGEASFPLIELRVEKHLYGMVEASVIQVTRKTSKLEESGPLVPGEKGFWFLRSIPASQPDEAGWDRLCGKIGLMVDAGNGFGRLPIVDASGTNRVSVPADVSLPTELLDCARRSGERQPVPRARFEAWIAHTIASESPRIEVRWITPGPSDSVVLTPDKRLVFSHGIDETWVQLSPERWNTILEGFERERFAELPDSVGWQRAPDEPELRILLRSSRGVKCVDIDGALGPSRDRPRAAEEMARTYRVLAEIPFAKDWSVGRRN